MTQGAMLGIAVPVAVVQSVDDMVVVIFTPQHKGGTWGPSHPPSPTPDCVTWSKLLDYWPIPQKKVEVWI